MTDSWKMTLPCRRSDSDMLSGEIPELTHLETPPVLTVRERRENSDSWLMEAFFEGKPEKDVIRRLVAIVRGARMSDAKIEKLPDEDWVTMSQSGLEPFGVGRFFIHTQQEEATAAGALHPIQIEASRAFGTGHHETTSGCLAAIDELQSSGRCFRNIADIGTGSGLLSFAALHLWPLAKIIASDIDPQAVEVAEQMAQQNNIPLGRSAGQLTLLTASGTQHPSIQRRAPYDLLIANILAGPLIELAPAFAAVVAPNGTLLLAGLMTDQAGKVNAAYRAAGFRVDRQIDNGEWPILRLTKRVRYGRRRSNRAARNTSHGDGDFGEW